MKTSILACSLLLIAASSIAADQDKRAADVRPYGHAAEEIDRFAIDEHAGFNHRRQVTTAVSHANDDGPAADTAPAKSVRRTAASKPR